MVGFDKGATNMTGRAAQELAALGGEVAQVDDAATALTRISPEDDERAAPGKDGKAKFGTAEAIATTVLSSLILSPAGAVVLGGAQGWLKKRSDQAMLDQIAEEQNILTSAGDVYDNQLNEFKTTATNPNDLEQLGVMASGLTAARKFITSSDPAMRDVGLQKMDAVDQQMHAYANRQETQRIAADAREADLKMALGDKEYDRYSAMHRDYISESQPFMETMRFGDLTLRALEGGTAAQMYTAYIGFNKAIDANSAVLGEEREAAGAFGSLMDQGYAAFKQAWDGTPSTSTIRRDMANAVQQTMAAMQTQQDIRETGYTDRLAQDNFNPKYNDDFMLSQSYQVYQPKIKPDASEIAMTMDRIARDNQSMLIGDAVDATKATAKTIGQNIDLGLSSVEQFVDEFGDDVQRNATELFEKVNTGPARFLTGRPTN